MSGLMAWLEGKKTYIVMILGFVFNIGVVAGWWTVDNQVWDLINLILGFLGIGAIRSGLKSEVNKIVSK
jgi:hypothetical protein